MSSSEETITAMTLVPIMIEGKMEVLLPEIIRVSKSVLKVKWRS